MIINTHIFPYKPNIAVGNEMFVIPRWLVTISTNPLIQLITSFFTKALIFAKPFFEFRLALTGCIGAPAHPGETADFLWDQQFASTKSIHHISPLSRRGLVLPGWLIDIPTTHSRNPHQLMGWTLGWFNSSSVSRASSVLSPGGIKKRILWKWTRCCWWRTTTKVTSSYNCTTIHWRCPTIDSCTRACHFWVVGKLSHDPSSPVY